MKSLKHIYLLIAGTVVMFSAFSQAPQGVNYQAVARNASGVMANKSLAVRISILAGSTAGSADYVEKHSVTTNTYGLFNLVMGSGSAQTGTFAGISWGSGSKFLKVEIDTNNGNSYTTLSNTQMMSVPYALYAEKTGGGSGVTGSGTTNYVSKWSSSSALTDALIYDNGSGVAIGTASPNSNNKFTVSSGNLVSGYFETNNASNNAHAVEGVYNGTGQFDGVGVYGKSRPKDSYGIGGSFEGGWMGTLGQVLNANDSFYTGTFGNVGTTANSIGFSIGARGRVEGGKGTNVGGYFESFGDTNAIGLLSFATPTNHASLSDVFQRGNAGGAFYSSDGQGVYGNAYDSYDIGSTYKGAAGVVGLSSAASGGYNAGIIAYGTHGNSTCTGIEAYGDKGNGSPIYVIGIVASVTGTGSSGAFAGYFDGDVSSTGALSKASGSFKIDHPQDPANKYLIHSFVESPDMMNVYNGNITTDANGTATVQLPNYFMAENKDFRYQLTVMGTFAQAIVFEEVKDNQFVIKTDKPNVKVSWQVTGIRQDAWANAHRIQAEVVKTGAEKGRYIHPALFGKSIDYSIPALTRSYTPSGQTVTPIPTQLTGKFPAKN